jgi:hypothetical protein
VGQARGANQTAADSAFWGSIRLVQRMEPLVHITLIALSYISTHIKTHTKCYSSPSVMDRRSII